MTARSVSASLADTLRDRLRASELVEERLQVEDDVVQRARVFADEVRAHYPRHGEGQPRKTILERGKALLQFVGRHARDLLTPAGPRRADW